MWFLFVVSSGCFVFSLHNYLFSYNRVILFCWGGKKNYPHEWYILICPPPPRSTVVSLEHLTETKHYSWSNCIVTTYFKHQSCNTQSYKTCFLLRVGCPVRPNTARSGHLHASPMGAIPLCLFNPFIFLLGFFFGFFGFQVIVVVELNCEIHLAHNLKIKLLKVKCFIFILFIFNFQVTEAFGPQLYIVVFHCDIFDPKNVSYLELLWYLYCSCCVTDSGKLCQVIYIHWTLSEQLNRCNLSAQLITWQ